MSTYFKKVWYKYDYMYVLRDDYLTKVTWLPSLEIIHNKVHNLLEENEEDPSYALCIFR